MNSMEQKNKSEEINDLFEANNIDKIDLSVLGDKFKEEFLNEIRKLKEMSQLLQEQSIKLQDAVNDLNIKANENNQNKTEETE